MAGQLIYANAKQKKEIMEKFNASQTTVSLALRFKRNSPLSCKIREYAVNKLGAYPINF